RTLVCTFGCASAKRYGSLAAHDVADLVTAPKRATPAQWKRAALAVGAIAASAALDERVRDASRANQSRAADNIAKIVEPFGGRYGDRVLYGFLLAGAARIRHDAHWLSDVVAGAAIGTATARFIIATNDRRRATWSVAPIVGEGRRGVVMRVVSR